MTRKDIIKKFTDFIKAHGTYNTCSREWEIETFGLCSDYGIELADCTIDKVATEYEGHLCFFYNENTGDCDYDSAFKVADLVEFFKGLTHAFNEESDEFVENKMDEIRPIVEDALTSLVDDAFDRRELTDNILRDVTEDVIECADELYNDSDVRLAIVRVLLAKTSTE